MIGEAEVPSFDDLLAELAETPEEREVMALALEALAYAAPDAEPTPGLRERVLARVAEDGRPPVFTEGHSYFARTAELPWLPLVPGIDMKVLWHDPATGARTLMIRMAPNLPFPPHPHPAIEDLFLIEGEAWVGDVFMRAGDYCRAPADTAHNDVRSGARDVLAVVVSR